MVTKRDVLKKSLKMFDVGEKGDSPMVHGGPREKFFPSLYLSLKQLPSLKKKDVGDKVKMMVEGEVISHDKNSYKRRGEKERSSENFSLEVRKIGLI